MNCDRARELITPAAFGDLDEATRGAFQTHCRQCDECRERFEAARGLLGALGTAPVPAGLHEKIMTAGRDEADGVRSRRWRRRIIPILGTCAAAVFLAFGIAAAVWRGRPTPAVAHRPAAAAGLPEAGWSFVAGDAGNSRRIEAPDLPVPNHVLWTQTIGGETGTYKPLVWNDLILVGQPLAAKQKSGGRLVAYQGVDGAVRWSRTFETGDFFKSRNFPDRCVRGGRLWVTDGAVCLVLDAATGQEFARWSPPERAQGWGYLSADDQGLYGVAADGRAIFCVDPDTGKSKWLREAAGFVDVPALSGGRLFVHARDGAVQALDVAGGEGRWRVQHAALATRASVHARGRHVLVVTETDRILALDADRGELLWERRIAGAFASGLALSDEAAYVLAGSQALSMADGETVWRQSGALRGLCSAPTLVGEQVVTSAGARFGTLSVLGGSGQVVGSLENVAQWACEGPIISGNRIFTVGGGRLFALGTAKN